VTGRPPPTRSPLPSPRCKSAAAVYKKRGGNFDKRCESAYEIAAIL